MLLYETYNIDHLTKYTYVQLKYSTLWGWLEDEACWTVVSLDYLELASETGHEIQDKEVLFPNGYLSKIMQDKTSWCTQWQGREFILHPSFGKTSSSVWSPTSFLFIQHLAPPTLPLAAVAIHCELAQYAIAKKAMVMFSQHDYQGTFCPSPRIDFTLETTILLNDTLMGRSICPLWLKPIEIGASQSLSALIYLALHDCSWISICLLSVLLCCDSQSTIPSDWIGNPLCSYMLHTPLSAVGCWWRCSSLPTGMM